jgi:hypothetical protein
VVNDNGDIAETRVKVVGELTPHHGLPKPGSVCDGPQRAAPSPMSPGELGIGTEAVPNSRAT